MSEKPVSPPAFPLAENGREFGNYHGMSLRDYFAAAAMRTMLGSEGLAMEAAKRHSSLGARDALAKSAYEMADSMLKARQD